MADLNRRTLIKRVLASGSLAFGIKWSEGWAQDDDIVSQWKPNLWITFHSDNTAELTIERSEMGQGTLHGMASVFIDECDLDPEKVTFKHAGFDRQYNNREYGLQITGGSTSMSQGFESWRAMAAQIRGLMIRSASEQMGKGHVKLTTAKSHVISSLDGQSLSYGELLRTASKLELEDFPLKSFTEFHFIGKDQPRLDALPKASGKAIFGIDSTMPNLKVATIVHCPYFKGALKQINNLEDIRHNGVLGIFEISSGVAIVADSYWLASKVAGELDIEWSNDMPQNFSYEPLIESYRKSLDDADVTVRDDGDIETELATQSKIVEAEYIFPFCAHKTLEPMNTTCHIEKGRCYLKSPTQAPALAVEVVKELTGFSEENIEIEVTYIGGGFGRRLNTDYVKEAVEIALISKNPIKLIWSREEDMKNDFYRPMAVHRFRASLNKEGLPSAWHHTYTTQPILPNVVSSWAPAMLPAWTPDFIKGMAGRIGSAVSSAFPANDLSSEGAKEIPYQIANLKIEMSPQDVPVPIGFWRSVGHSLNGPAIECFLDELIAKVDQDPFEYRLKLLGGKDRYRRVLEKLRKFCHWDQRDRTKFYGVAQHHSFKSYTAQVVQLKRIDQKKFKIEKVYCVVDCGFAVNPDIVRMQIESGIVFGISSALYDELPFTNGQPDIHNFHDSPVLRMNMTPEILVDIIASSEGPTGVGEVSVPSSIPALMNALSRAKGERVRRLPLGDYFGS